MKKLSILTIILIIAGFSTFTEAQIKVVSGGTVGIGTTSPSATYKLDISGKTRIDPDVVCGELVIDNSMWETPGSVPTVYPSVGNYGYLGKPTKKWGKIYCLDLLEGSDKRLKKNIRDLNGALVKVIQMRGVSYDFHRGNQEDVSHANIDKINTYRTNKLGFIAQELQKVVPEVVEYDSENDVYSVNKIDLIPVLVEAIKEQQLIIEELGQEVKSLKNAGVNATKSTQKSSSKGDMPEKGAQLFQNTPNPFTQNTTIAMLIPDEVANATLYVYDMQGTQKKSIPVNSRGNTSVNISGGEFEAGMYMYTLIADGKEVDTKRMILTE